MSIFLLPKQVCTDLESLMCKFWWRSSAKQTKGIHWMSWDRLCMKKSEGGMGFIKLHDFNIALLGKQAWRLIKRPDSIVSKVYKARYFPTGSLLSAKIGSNPSYVWRSILASQDLVASGTIRRVGNGRSVDILKDPWLPCVEDPYIHTTHEALRENTVSSLMSMDQDAWDLELINDIFVQRDVNLILSIPIKRAENDSWFWSFDKLGHFTVKSAYTRLRERASNFQSSNNSGFWNKMWNLKIPLKVKHFVWKLVRNCLPTRDQLLIKRVEVSSMCPVCNLANETTLHVILKCPVARLCWQKLGYTFTSCNYMEEWTAEVLQHSRRNVINKVFMVAWSIWKNRNDIVWNQRGTEYEDIVISAIQVLNNWENAHDRSFDNTVGFLTQTEGDVHWQQPQIDQVKVNTDAALFTDPDCFSYAMVARDHYGHLLEAISICKQGCLNPELAEAIGIREALSWVKQKGWNSAIVESDCLGAIQAIRCSSVNLSYFGRVIDDCKKILDDLESQNVILKFVRRSANKVAHYIARHSSSLADRRWGMGDAHPDLIHVLQNDLIVQ